MKRLLRIIKLFFHNLYQLFAAAGQGFIDDRVMKLSASLAYYTIFSLTPLIIIILSSVTLFLGDNLDPGTKIFGGISELIGTQATGQLRTFVNNANLSGRSTLGLTIGIITLLIGSSAIFVEIQDSINLIWKVKAIPKKGWLKFIVNRLLSFSLIASLGFLLLVSLILNSVVVAIGGKLDIYAQRLGIGSVSELLMLIITNILTYAVITTIFVVIFKVLPDVKLKWKSAIVGALFTALLFSLGKYLIGIYIEKGNPGSTFGAASSIIVILVWIYYTSIILYFGAEFTQAYAEKFDKGISPSKYAVHLKTVVIEKEVKELPPQHPEEITPVKTAKKT
ncbi:YihY/virulence factor BrkB family protein [Pedobacter sp.]|uniref:YihY/virulence factor BrkB family protein n=1 Tax=Pedobacter sp. TaxID=1411316 RepID=UPI00396C34D9